jgi:flagellar hook protein FlgE
MISSIPGNAFSASLAGLQQAQGQMNQAAASIANPNAAADVVSLSEAAISMKMAEVAFKANAQTIKAADAMLGTLIDTKA